jgi:16S rRNA (guanine527-N7)-methyltransferase
VTDATFLESARHLGFDLDDMAQARFAAYRRLMIESAAKFSLTNIRDPGAIDRRHFLAALAEAAALETRGLLATGARIIDVGSGAGLPAMPVKIARPDLDVSLLDANGKRCAFLRAVVEDLGLEGAQVLEGRAEALAHDPNLRESFDLVLARAVAPLPVLVELTLPFVRTGGHLAATKGAGAQRELAEARRAIDELGGSAAEVFAVPSEGEPGRLVLIAKARPTPHRYPRRTGVPAKRPLV